MATKSKAKPAKTTTLTLTNDQILIAHSGLVALTQLRTPLPVPFGMKVRRILRVVKPLSEDIQEERKRLVETYAELDENGEIQEDEKGEIIFQSPEKRKEYIKAHRELMELEIEVTTPTLNASDIADKNLQTSVLVALDDLLVDDLDD